MKTTRSHSSILTGYWQEVSQLTGTRSQYYTLVKSWNDRRGHKMHRIQANYSVRAWLNDEHPQAGNNNPDWWKYNQQINITDKLYMLLVMRWAQWLRQLHYQINSGKN